MKTPMKYIPLLIAAHLVMGSAVRVEARLGETEQECAARYGNPTKQLSANQLLYTKSGLLIIASFHNGKVDMISYRKVAENALGKGEQISDTEIEILMKSNTGDAIWKKRPVISMDREWQTEDGNFFASYSTFENFLLVTTKEYLAREKAAKDAKEGQNLEGF
jgi:hypothetical protein